MLIEIIGSRPAVRSRPVKPIIGRRYKGKWYDKAQGTVSTLVPAEDAAAMGYGVRGSRNIVLYRGEWKRVRKKQIAATALFNR